MSSTPTPTRIAKDHIYKFAQKVRDANNPYDDSKDIETVLNMAKTDKNFRRWIEVRRIKTEVDTADIRWKIKPNGPKGVDLHLIDKSSDDKVLAAVEVEHMTKMDPDFPKFYKYISFLKRKRKFFEETRKDGHPLLMIYVNHQYNKLLAVNISHRTLDEASFDENRLDANGYIDSVYKLPFDFGYIFANDGVELSDLEKERFLRYAPEDENSGGSSSDIELNRFFGIGVRKTLGLLDISSIS